MPFFRRRRTRTRAGSALQDVDPKSSRRWSIREMIKGPQAVERELVDLKLTESSSRATDDVPVTPAAVASEDPIDHAGVRCATPESQEGARQGNREEHAATLDTADGGVGDASGGSETGIEMPIQESEIMAAFDGSFRAPRNPTAARSARGECSGEQQAIHDDPVPLQDCRLPEDESLGTTLKGSHIVPSPELEMHGLYAGSVGLKYFEHIQAEVNSFSVSHNDNVGQGSDVLGNLEVIARAPESYGLRSLDFQYIVDRLVEISKSFPMKARQRQEEDLGRSTTALFTKVLHPPSQMSDADTAPRPQAVQALINVLGRAGPWYNLTIETNRILIGQILFNQNSCDEMDEATAETLPALARRDVVLLQLLLACELYLRTAPNGDIGDDGKPSRPRSWTFDEDVTFTSDSSRVKVGWDLAMAHVFLENIHVLPRIKKIRKLSTLERAKRLFFPASFATPAEAVYEEKPDILLLPRYQERQILCLTQFARDIGWPEADDLEQILAQKFPPVSLKRSVYGSSRRASAYGTPSPSIGSSYAQEATDYFTSRARPSLDRQRSRPPMRPQVSRGRRSQMSVQLAVATPLDTPSQSPYEQPASPTSAQQLVGWLTCTYLTGFILPGESLQHLLISCMLENSPEAMFKLGETATLLGGFVYDGRSYWSSQCIVGRVLAGLRGSSEGWGWTGTDCVPTVVSSAGGSSRASSDGWIDIMTEQVVPSTVEFTDVSQDLQEHAPDDVCNDYVVPVDSLRQPSNLLWFDGLQLTPDSEEMSWMDEPEAGPATCTAAVSFSSASLSSEIGSARIQLKHDVHFVSATPCRAPPIEALLRLKLIAPAELAALRQRGSHPLHRSQHYGIVSALEVVKRSFAAPEAGQTLVLDARGSETLELLARAWCASVGRHAIVGSEDDACVACCVRKAVHAGISIVIRI